jgi:hypothetical protein
MVNKFDNNFVTNPSANLKPHEDSMTRPACHGNFINPPHHHLYANAFAFIFLMPIDQRGAPVRNFFDALRTQRFDDHRYYHHSRINQTLHLISAISFLIAYAMLFVDPVMSALIAWLVSMTTRQSGHFFFEPLGYDEVNQASQEFKEEIKVGYNLNRKIVLLSIWALLPLALYVQPGLFGLVDTWTTPTELIRQIGASWLLLGVSGLLFRTVHLCFIKDVQTGLVWMTKILTDPFHDIILYHKAPLYLMRGELIDNNPKQMYH